MRVVKAERPGHLLVRAAFHFPAPGTAAFLQFAGTMPWLLRIRGSIFPQNGYFKSVRQAGYRKCAKKRRDLAGACKTVTDTPMRFHISLYIALITWNKTKRAIL